jgi:coproporphyrinogen III oxidase-like Fe-S oxidoreductase
MELGGFNSTELKQLDSYLQNDLMRLNDDHYVLTEKGKLQADGIASSFFRLD